jgi:hypothetical protein
MAGRSSHAGGEGSRARVSKEKEIAFSFRVRRGAQVLGRRDLGPCAAVHRRVEGQQELEGAVPASRLATAPVKDSVVKERPVLPSFSCPGRPTGIMCIAFLR